MKFTFLFLSLVFNDPQRTVLGETVAEKESRDKIGIRKSFDEDMKAIVDEAEKKLQRESEINKRWIRAKARGQKPVQSIKAKDASRMLAMNEVKAWLRIEEQKRKMEEKVKEDNKREEERKVILDRLRRRTK